MFWIEHNKDSNEDERDRENYNKKIIFRKLFLSSTESTIYFSNFISFRFFSFAHRRILNNSPFFILFQFILGCFIQYSLSFSPYISLSFSIVFKIYSRLRSSEFNWMSLPTATAISLTPDSPFPLPL